MSDRRDSASTDDDIPQIIVQHLGPRANIIKHIEHGIEEEGVPLKIRRTETNGSSPNHQRNVPTVIAYQAASDSGLKIGVGVSEKGDLTLHHARLPDDEPLISVTDATTIEARIVGTNAARVAKRMPLKLLD